MDYGLIGCALMENKLHFGQFVLIEALTGQRSGTFQVRVPLYVMLLSKTNNLNV